MVDVPNSEQLIEAIDRDGYAILPGLIDTEACAELAAKFKDPLTHFRSTIDMARHGFGRGTYRYFAQPLPPLVQAMREGLYPALATVANEWAMRLPGSARWPLDHGELIAACQAAGQDRPTPLLLRYQAGDYNRLHQDIYGALVFPLQLVVLLDMPQRDFTGGEFVLVEGRARMQSRAAIVPLTQGDAVIFPVRERPVASSKGWSRATMRHGVAEIRSGTRRTLGIIFHDAA